MHVIPQHLGNANAEAENSRTSAKKNAGRAIVVCSADRQGSRRQIQIRMPPSKVATHTRAQDSVREIQTHPSLLTLLVARKDYGSRGIRTCPCLAPISKRKAIKECSSFNVLFHSPYTISKPPTTLNSKAKGPSNSLASISKRISKMRKAGEAFSSLLWASRSGAAGGEMLKSRK